MTTVELSVCHLLKISNIKDTARRGENLPHTCIQLNSVCESLSALCASSLEDLSSISGLHTLAEAVLLFSLALFRLVCSEHYTYTSVS